VGLEAIRQDPVDESIEHLFHYIEAAQVPQTTRARYGRCAQLHLENESAVLRDRQRSWPLPTIAVFIWILVDETLFGDSTCAVKRLEVLRQQLLWSFKDAAR
jgi:hypothetical protein